MRTAMLVSCGLACGTTALADGAGSLEYAPLGAGAVTAIPTLGVFGLILLGAALAWYVLRQSRHRHWMPSFLLAGTLLLGGVVGGGWAPWVRAAGLFGSVDLDQAAGGTKTLSEGVTKVVNRTSVALRLQALTATAPEHAFADLAGVQGSAAPQCQVGLTLAPGAHCSVLLVNTSEALDLESAAERFGEFMRRLATAAPDVLTPPALDDLVDQVGAAQVAYDHGLTCIAADILSGVMQQAQQLRNAQTQPLLEDVYSRAHALRAELVGGVPAGSHCFDPAVGRTPEVVLAASDDNHVAGIITFGAARIWSVGAIDGVYTQVEIPGLETSIGAPGLPAIPGVQRLIAVPEGAQLEVTFNVQPQALLKLNLYPFQDMPVDQVREPAPDPARFADLPFVKNADAYSASTFGPESESVCAITPVGDFRGLRLAQLSCSAGQYNPQTQELRLFERISFDVRFPGGDGRFVDSQATSPFEERIGQGVRNAALNSTWLAHKADLAAAWRKQGPDVIAQPDWLRRACVGEEYLIFTHDDFRLAAERLAAWKNKKGIATRVFTVGGKAGATMGNDYFPLDTAENIAQFIDHRFDHCVVRPAYILLLGDAEFIPPFQSPLAEDDYTGTDYPYAVYGAYNFSPSLRLANLVPSYAVGRIPVDTPEDADVVINKIIRYEEHPPLADAQTTFYKRAAIASQFQCCQFDSTGANPPLAGTAQRSFIESSEYVRRALVQDGYAVDRIYTRTVDEAYTGDATPRRYFNGQLLPAELRAANGFAWNGDTNAIIDAWNGGRFLVIHRDHGWPNGWANPYFYEDWIDYFLRNDELQPVVYSINCASGLFDNETLPQDMPKGDTGQTLGRYYNTGEFSIHFAELALRSRNGAIGVIGDTRDSPTWPNSALMRGLVDATWPDTDPAFGGSTRHRRLGDILNWGKLYLLGQVGVAQTAGSVWRSAVRYEGLIWHVIGDPTLEMWTRNPHSLRLAGDYVLQQISTGALPDLIVDYPQEGAVITVFQDRGDGQAVPLGRAQVQGGSAQLKFITEREPGLPLQVSACMSESVCVALVERAGG